MRFWMACVVGWLALATAGPAARPMKWESLMLLKAAAEKGEREAQFLIGVQYKAGDGFARDRAEAARWLRLAAASGHAEAQFTLGELYGETVSEDGLADPVEAAKWLQAAAAQGHAGAKARLDALLATKTSARTDASSPADQPAGPGKIDPAGSPATQAREMDEDPAETVRWSLLLSGLRGAEAYLVRGFMLENGIVVNRDLAAATDSYRKAAARGSSEAVAALARLKAPPLESAGPTAKPDRQDTGPAKKP